MIPDVQMADRAVADAHERSYGRLVGWLFRRTGDLQLAEDAVFAAFASAVVTWRRSGVPDSPEAWLRVAARNHALNALRAVTRVTSVPPEVFELREGPIDSIPQFDDRLGLLFVCAHPAVNHRMHAPIMLQAVLGVDAARIGRVFLTAPATMGQRLSRAKAKIRDAGIRFRIPEPSEWRARVGTVLQAIYAVYGVSDPIADGPDDRDELLRAEAVRLARLIVELLPDHAEGLGAPRSVAAHGEPSHSADRRWRIRSAVGAGRRTVVGAAALRGRESSSPRCPDRHSRPIPAGGGHQRCALREGRRAADALVGHHHALRSVADCRTVGRRDNQRSERAGRTRRWPRCKSPSGSDRTRAGE